MPQCFALNILSKIYLYYLVGKYSTVEIIIMEWPLASGVGRISFRGERSGHLKAITPPPAGGPGAKAPRTVAKFHFLKQFKVFGNESSFNNSNIFLSEKFIFSKKNFEKLNIFYKNF